MDAEGASHELAHVLERAAAQGQPVGESALAGGQRPGRYLPEWQLCTGLHVQLHQPAERLVSARSREGALVHEQAYLASALLQGPAHQHAVPLLRNHGLAAAQFRDAAASVKGEEAQRGHVLGRTPQAAVDDGQRHVDALVGGADPVVVVALHVLVEEVYVAYAHPVTLPQNVGAVEAAAEPDGTPQVVRIVVEGGTGVGGCHGILLAELPGRLDERLHPQPALLLKLSYLGQLHLVAFTEHIPRKGVLLPGLEVGVAQSRVSRLALQVPAHPLRFLRVDVGGLHRANALHGTAYAGTVLIEGVAAQHAEDGQVYLPLPGLRRHIGIHSRGVVRAMPVAPPERIAVCAYLVTADAAALNAVSLPHVGQRVGVDEP